VKFKNKSKRLNHNANLQGGNNLISDFIDKMPIDDSYGWFETVYHHLILIDDKFEEKGGNNRHEQNRI
jgi:hypothetical protein